MKTARQVVVQAVAEWLDSNDIGRFTEIQRLEDRVGIWEYGKWCKKGSLVRLGCKPQIKFRGSRPESTEWDGIPDISDDQGMTIHAATVGMSSLHVEVIERIYEDWQNVEHARSQMGIGMGRLDNLRLELLRRIANHLFSKNA